MDGYRPNKRHLCAVCRTYSKPTLNLLQSCWTSSTIVHVIFLGSFPRAARLSTVDHITLTPMDAVGSIYTPPTLQYCIYPDTYYILARRPQASFSASTSIHIYFSRYIACAIEIIPAWGADPSQVQHLRRSRTDASVLYVFQATPCISDRTRFFARKTIIIKLDGEECGVDRSSGAIGTTPPRQTEYCRQ